ncbi:MAG: glycosyltransferase [Bacteroidota bacterium]|nr:glycosyltransferase [Bacteroidota bacterium]
MELYVYYLQKLLDFGLLIYCVVIFTIYFTLAILSAIALIHYLRKNRYVDLSPIMTSPLAPSVSILAPAYNEGKTIVENARSLLSLHYVDFEVIIVNDGSKDDTLERMIEEYNMVKVDFAVNYQIECQPIRGVYKSPNPAFSKLTLIDKVNGGKADALNAGINVSSKRLFATIDVDCIIEYDGLLKMVKPFIEEKDKKVIASGGVVRVANSCEIENGRIKTVVLPKNLWARFQVLEYFRAFILGRMAWSKLNGLLLISGAFGLFDREIAVKAGGYNHKTVGEDMELVVRMRRYMHDHNLGKYLVTFIPDPLCWTEVPDSLNILGRQRNRWARGTIDSLRMHKVMFANPKYGRLGLISFPYWFFFEWLAPFTEFFGLIYFTFLAIGGNINFMVFLILFIFVYSLSVMFSMWAIVAEEISFHQYTRKTDILKLILTAMLEPFIFHPLGVYWSLKGNYDYFFKGKKEWGEMTRKGFGKKP